jgi:hypothetical protein
MTDARLTTVEFMLTREDAGRYATLYQRLNRGAQRYLSFAYAPVALGFFLMLLARVGGLTSREFGALLFVAFAAYLTGVLCYRHEVLATYREAVERRLLNPRLLGRRTLSLKANGIEFASDTVATSTAYVLLDGAEITSDHLCIWIDGIDLVAVPLRAFPSRVEADAFCEDLQARVTAARAAAANASTPT